jgi:hypothetical protein
VLRTDLPTIQWKALGDAVEQLRMIKDESEILAIQHSIGLTTLLKEPANRTEPEQRAGLNVDSIVEFNSRAVVRGLTRTARETYPIALMINDSDPDNVLPTLPNAGLTAAQDPGGTIAVGPFRRAFFTLAPQLRMTVPDGSNTINSGVCSAPCWNRARWRR